MTTKVTTKDFECLLYLHAKNKIMLAAKKHLSHECIYKREVTLPVFIFLTHYKRKLLVMYSGTNK